MKLVYNYSKMNTEVYSAKLRTLKLVPTIQRIAVLRFLDESHSHPTAEEIYNGVKDAIPSLTRATVYNVLNALKRVKAIQEVIINREIARYDGNANPHLHFLCRSCENLYDIDLACVLRPGDVLCGHRVEAVQIYLYGICVQCVSSNINNDNESKKK
jgi:Fur family peroxide stress response transcriptional regulator